MHGAGTHMSGSCRTGLRTYKALSHPADCFSSPGSDASASSPGPLVPSSPGPDVSASSPGPVDPSSPGPDVSASSPGPGPGDIVSNPPPSLSAALTLSGRNCTDHASTKCTLVRSYTPDWEPDAGEAAAAAGPDAVVGAAAALGAAPVSYLVSSATLSARAGCWPRHDHTGTYSPSGTYSPGR